MPQVDVPVSQKLRVTLLQRQWNSCVIQSGIAKLFNTSDTDDILITVADAEDSRSVIVVTWKELRMSFKGFSTNSSLLKNSISSKKLLQA